MQFIDSGTGIVIYVYGSNSGDNRQWHLFPPRDSVIKINESFSDVTLYQLYNRIVREESNAYVLLCNASVWLGRGIAQAAEEIIQELEELYPNWGFCGNSGERCDGGKRYPFVRMPGTNPINSLCPKPVLTAEDSVLLLNVRNLRNHRVYLPDVKSKSGFGLVLSCEALMTGLLPVVDCRLMSCYFPQNERSLEHLEKNKELKGYLRDHFINHLIPTVYGPLLLSDEIDYSYLLLEKKSHTQRDLVSLFDEALSISRTKCKPSVQIVCRTQLNRLYLLDRAVASFAAAHIEAKGMIDLSLCIVTDQSVDMLNNVCTYYKKAYPFLPIEGLFCPPSGLRFSRVELLLSAITQSRSHYLWFIDDDDFILPAAIPMICRSLLPNRDVIVAGSSVGYEESWVQASNPHPCPETTSWKLVDSKRTTGFQADGIFTAFSGENLTPICSVLFPARVLKNRVDNIRAEGDYLEDYFILLLALTSERIEVETLEADICGISYRGTENTIREADRSRWNFSYATFFQELFMQKTYTSPILWQLWYKATEKPST
jgi:hypothetical protein